MPLKLEVGTLHYIELFMKATVQSFLYTILTQSHTYNVIPTALPPPPGPQMVIVSSESSLTVSWSPPSGPVEGGVGGCMFGVTGEGCGCVSMNVSGDTTSVTCSGWTAAGQTCSFEVRTLSQDCGFASEPVNTNVSLRSKFKGLFSDNLTTLLF